MIVLTNVQSVGQCHRHQGQNYPLWQVPQRHPQISEAMRHQKYRPQDHRPNNFLERYFIDAIGNCCCSWLIGRRSTFKPAAVAASLVAAR